VSLIGRMSVHHDLMMEALKKQLLPVLRERGFKGRFPHFRRAGRDRIDFVMIQFRRGGGSFTINIGQSGPQGIDRGPWADLPVEKLTVGHLTTRSRISTGFLDGQWFEFGPNSYEDQKPAKPTEFYDGSPRKLFNASTKTQSPGSLSRAAVDIKYDVQMTTYSTLGKSGKRAPHGSFILWGIHCSVVRPATLSLASKSTSAGVTRFIVL
jgi:hypothetical protein